MTTIDTQLASAHVPVLYLVEMQFTTGTLRVTNWNHQVTYLGHDWSALNAITSISPVKASEALAFPAMDLGMQVGSDAVLTLALGDPATYRFRDVLVYQAYMDDELRPLDDPELVWAGEMSQVRVNTGNGEDDGGSIVMRCEQQGKDSRSVRSLRLNHAQQIKRWPGDTFLSRIETLSGKPTSWLSKRFQQQ